MRIALATDDASAVVDAAERHLVEAGHEVERTGTGVPWVDAGRSVGEAVASGRADLGVVWCHTGTGVSIAANKVRGVRAALCTDAATAAGARRWNDANVLCLSLRLTTADTAAEILDAFVDGTPDPGELGVIAALEGPAAAP